jgi:hypothetical protein
MAGGQRGGLVVGELGVIERELPTRAAMRIVRDGTDTSLRGGSDGHASLGEVTGSGLGAGLSG